MTHALLPKPALSKRHPLVSIGMSVYNTGPFIADAIASILAQTYVNWELIILDDGSQDDTLEIIRQFDDPRIRVISDGTNKGLPARLNQAVDLAKGTLFARMDGDDICWPDRLEKQVAYLHAHPEVDLLAAELLTFRTDGTVDGRQAFYGETHAEITRAPWSGMHMNHATWVGHIAWFRANRYNEDAVRMEDEELMLRSYRHSCFARMPDILYGYRVDELSLTKILRARRGFMAMMFREAQRQRDPRLLIGVLTTALKACVDIFAIKSGLGYKILPHRASSPDSADIAEWRRIEALVDNVRLQHQRPERQLDRPPVPQPRPPYDPKRTESV